MPLVKGITIGCSDQEKDGLFSVMFLGVFVLWLILESIKVKVHETLTMFSNANESGVVQALDGLFVSIYSFADEGIRDVALPVNGFRVVLGVVEVTVILFVVGFVLIV